MDHFPSPPKTKKDALSFGPNSSLAAQFSQDELDPGLFRVEPGCVSKAIRRATPLYIAYRVNGRYLIRVGRAAFSPKRRSLSAS